MREGDGMVQIHSLAFSFGVVLIDQDDFRSQTIEEKGIGEGCANVANTNNGDAKGCRRCRGSVHQSFLVFNCTPVRARSQRTVKSTVFYAPESGRLKSQ